MRSTGAVVLGVLLAAAAPESASELAAPTRVEADGRPIDVYGGHAAPAVADLDGDGARDLLVGQFLDEGRNPFQGPMRVYRGAGAGTALRFSGFLYLSGADGRASVPTG